MIDTEGAYLTRILRYFDKWFAIKLTIGTEFLERTYVEQIVRDNPEAIKLLHDAYSLPFPAIREYL